MHDNYSVTSFESISTWRQPEPAPASEARSGLIAALAETVTRLTTDRLSVAIDGFTAAGKTTCGHELAAALRQLGLPTLRASMDDFKNPWREATQLGYDRLSGEDYYRNAYDFISATQLLLGPAGPDGSGQVVLGAHDPLTGEDHRDVTVFAPPDAILIVDSLFAFRPQYNTYWEYRIWLDVDPHLSLTRGIERDMDAERRDEAVQVHRDRYKTAEAIYVAEVKAWAKADILIDNSDFANPRLLRPESIAHSP